MTMQRKSCLSLLLAVGLACAATPGSASTETVLHTMCSSSGCADGEIPQSQLIKSGNVLYGVAPSGGSHNGGVAFQYDLSSSTYSVIYNFCTTHVPLHPTICSDGESPTGRLVIDSDGNLYGTTQLGGNANNAGTVYKLTKSGSTWSLSSLYKFCPEKIGDLECDDGDDPLSGLTYYGQASDSAYDGSSALYGSTYVGGNDSAGAYGNGVIFKLTLSGGTWSQSVMHEFCPSCTELCYSCSDGERPIGQMILDGDGALWGSTEAGGGGGEGVVFKLTGSGTETTLYTFCSTHASPCSDGGQPTGVLLDASGNIFGTAQIGGSGGSGSGAGTLFKLTNSGGTWSESVKYNFCSASSCNDGSVPRGDLIMDSSGNIFGTTALGGSHAVVSGGAGTIWKYNGTSESVLYKFCPTSSTCADGEDPGAGVMMDASANLYGDTVMGGGSAGGVVYKFVP